MSNPWFRMYSEFSHDPKVQMLSEAMQRRYIMLMCLRCSDTLVTLQDEEVAFHLRISNEELSATKALFVAKGFIDSQWNLLNWEKRQFASDTSKARVAKHRALLKDKQKDDGNADVTLHAKTSNALDTDTDTDTDTDKDTDKKIEDKKTRAEALECPSDVIEQVWSDFLKIRKAKKSPLTNTALIGIQREADNAGVTLETALKTCCERGWVGFKAEWLVSKTDAVETVYQKSMRLRVAEIAPELARAAPGTQNITDYFRTIDVSPLKTLEISQ